MLCLGQEREFGAGLRWLVWYGLVRSCFMLGTLPLRLEAGGVGRDRLTVEGITGGCPASVYRIWVTHLSFFVASYFAVEVENALGLVPFTFCYILPHRCGVLQPTPTVGQRLISAASDPTCSNKHSKHRGGIPLFWDTAIHHGIGLYISSTQPSSDAVLLNSPVASERPNILTHGSHHARTVPAHLRATRS